jgi:hypothetical protein
LREVVCPVLELREKKRTLTKVGGKSGLFPKKKKEVHMQCVDDAYTPTPPAQYEQPTDGP